MIIILSTATLLTLTCILFYFKKTNATHWQTLLAAKETELTKLHAQEENLRQELKTLEIRLHDAIEDPLTKLLGWTLFEDRVRQSIHESARYQFNMAVLYVDINDFSVINDALGYEAGDAILNEVSLRLQTCIREMDSVSRLSKDIFVVLLTQLAKPETSAIVAQRILESLLQPILVKEQKLYITACIGISIYPADGLDAAVLFRNADYALQLAKEKGNQNYHFYQQKDGSVSLRELEISTGLKQDSFLSECEIYYQPIIHAKDKTIFCMQALLYWRHPGLGLIHADELSVHMDKHDKSNLVLEWLIKKACQQFITWRGLGFQPEFLSVSLSVRQLKNSQLIYRLSQVLQECDFKPEWLLLVIEGNLAQTSFGAIEKSFNMLKYLNIKLAINHFGINLFSIRDLQTYPLDYLVLDACMINQLQQNENAASLVQAINMLAKSLSLQLIVQGVDSEKTMQILQGLGCDLVQGQFIGEPRSEKEVTL